MRVLEGKRAAGNASPMDMVELALLYWEPYHEEETAVATLRELLAREPRNNLAKLWIAYIYVYYYFMLGVSLDDAKEILSEIISSGERAFLGAAKVVLYGALRDFDRSEKTRPARTTCLEESIAMEPGWVNNHHYLAGEYFEAGRYSEALDEVRNALANVAESCTADLLQLSFETYITGRFLHGVRANSLVPMEEKILRLCPALR